MRQKKQYYVCIMANESRMLYVGVTGDLFSRVYQHKNMLIPGYTSTYNITRLMHFEETDVVQVAIAREKQIKGWVRKKKVALIESAHSRWQDLSDGCYKAKDPSRPPPHLCRTTHAAQDDKKGAPGTGRQARFCVHALGS